MMLAINRTTCRAVWKNSLARSSCAAAPRDDNIISGIAPHAERETGGQAIDATTSQSSTPATAREVAGTEGRGTPPAKGTGWSEGLTSVEYVAATDQFVNEFAPQVGTDYSLALEWAKDQFAGRMKDFDDIDAKAHAVIGYMGGTAGALTVGGVIALTSQGVSGWVAVATLPSIALAAIATVFAVLCRRTGRVPVPFGTSDLVANAESAQKHTAENSKLIQDAWLIGRWWRADAHLSTEVNRKASWLNRSFILYASSVCGLLLPFMVAVGIKFADESKPQPTPPTTAHVQ